MSTDEIIHPRLYKVAGVCYADDEAISQQDFDDLREHYYAVVDALAKPWLERDKDYDVTGRYNTGGMSEYEERF
jgi:hypothetical protein